MVHAPASAADYIGESARFVDALRKTASPEAANRRALTAPVWLGVLGAVTVAASFAAVLTYPQDVRRQFETIQERLVNEPLVENVQPFGGGYFYTMPGVTHAGDWYGRTLLS